MLTGFGNHHESEALSGALPIGRNSPQICPFNLYAEQINGTAFSLPRTQNLRRYNCTILRFIYNFSWLYRLKPSVGHEEFKPYTGNSFISTKEVVHLPNQLRWDPFELPEPTKKVDFVDGLFLIASAGSPAMRNGLNVLNYCFNSSMDQRAFYNADGDFLIGKTKWKYFLISLNFLVPQLNGLKIKTEFGILTVEINEICVIPRGIVFQVESLETSNPTRGYILEIFSGHFELPDLGPIGSNGLANPQDFQYPIAEFDRDDLIKKWYVLNKFGNELFVAERKGSPFNVVAWRGNYAPFKYNLNRFNAINSVSWDHPDPSIFTVLTCKGQNGPIADFVIFPPRWQVSENTFRPPYFHRNAMTEFMGLIIGDYEAKQDGGFVPGGASLHSLMTAHGPDAITFKAATSNPDIPQVPKKVAEGTMAFMFETSFILGVTPWALEKVQPNYCQVWEDLPEASII